jgi:hypothetical protein
VAYYAALQVGHSAAYWERVTAGQDFAREDDLDVGRFNRAQWRGLMGSQRYPTERSGVDLWRHKGRRLGARCTPEGVPVVARPSAV